MSTPGWITGNIVSSLWTVAAVVACSASFLHLLTADALGAVLDHLIQQELTLGTQQCWVCIGGRCKVGHRIVSGGERPAQPRDIELLGEEVVAQVIAFLRSDRFRVSLSVLHPNGAYHPGLERLDDLGAAAWQPLRPSRMRR
jgi:hypothetical protein